jgi:7-cyano-7-deazaguanine synthase
MNQKKQTKKTLLLLSGGLDSVALLYYLRATGEIVEALHFEYGNNHSRNERQFAVLHCKKTKTPLSVLHLPKMRGSKLTGGSGSWVVPGRNSIFLSHAVNFAEANQIDFIAYGSNSDDAADFPDCRVEWIAAFNQQITNSGLKCRVVAPFAALTKRQLVYFTRKVDPTAPLVNSWSCYGDSFPPCGECPACTKRVEALK